MLDTAVVAVPRRELDEAGTEQAIADGWNAITDEAGQGRPARRVRRQPWRPAIASIDTEPGGAGPRRTGPPSPRRAPSDDTARRVAFRRRGPLGVHLADRPLHPRPLDLPARRLGRPVASRSWPSARAASTSTSSASRTTSQLLFGTERSPLPRACSRRRPRSAGRSSSSAIVLAGWCASTRAVRGGHVGPFGLALRLLAGVALRRLRLAPRPGAGERRRPARVRSS